MSKVSREDEAGSTPAPRVTRSLLNFAAAAELLDPRRRHCAVDVGVHSVLLSVKSI
jgi:hypothetical protein